MITKFPTSKVIKWALALILLAVVLITTQVMSPVTDNTYADNTDNAIFTIINADISMTSINDLYNSVESKVAVIEAAQTRQKRIDKLVEYLASVHSPIATEHYATLIMDLAEANNVDYRIVVALMGTESGWCKAPIHYNCFGYLNGVEYESFDDAFNHLIPKIAQQYWVRYGWDLVGFIMDYGRIDQEYAIRYAGNMRAIINKLYY